MHNTIAREDVYALSQRPSMYMRAIQLNGVEVNRRGPVHVVEEHVITPEETTYKTRLKFEWRPGLLVKITQLELGNVILFKGDEVGLGLEDIGLLHPFTWKMDTHLKVWFRFQGSPVCRLVVSGLAIDRTKVARRASTAEEECLRAFEKQVQESRNED